MRLRGPGFRLLAGACAAVSSIALAAAAAAASVPAERGLRPLRTYGIEEHGGGGQNWAVVEDGRGVVYVGNLAGVLEFDGARWRLIATRNGSAVRSLAIDAAGRVVIGGFDELGYLVPDAKGRLLYVSLVPLVPAGGRPLGEIHACYVAAGTVFFVAETRILAWDGGTALRDVASLPDEADARSSFALPGGAAVWTREAGLRRLGAAGLEPMEGGERLAGRRVDLLVPIDAQRSLLVIRGEGVFVHDAARTAPFAAAASRWLAGRRVTHGCRLPDGRLAIATRDSGVLILDPEGEIDEVLDAFVGLADDEVAFAMPARDGSLWLALGSGGVSRVEASSPISVFDARLGLKGNPTAMTRHLGTFYVGGTGGLYTLRPADPADTSTGPRRTTLASPVASLRDSAWAFHASGRELLVGTSEGLWVVDEGKARRIPGTERLTVYCIQESRSEPGSFFAGLREGLGVLKRGERGWRLEGLVPGVPNQVRTIVDGGKGTLWLGTTLDGAVRVELAGPVGRSSRVTTYGRGEIYGYLLGGSISFASENGILRFDDASKRLVPDEQFAGMFRRSPYFAADAGDGRIWFATRPPSVTVPRPGGGLALEERLLIGMPGTDIQIVVPEPDGVVWFGTDKGLVRYDSRLATARKSAARPLVRRVVAGKDQELFGGAGTAPLHATALRHTTGRIRFECAPAAYEPGTLYQYRLDPSDTEWSEWIAEPVKEYTNLWEGRYRFRVRSKDRSEAVGPEAAYEFRVLPPWFRTPWAYGAYVLAAVLAVTAAGRVRHRLLLERNEVLRARVADRTAELGRAVEELRLAKVELEEKNSALSDANTKLEALSYYDPLTGIANRRRLQQVLADEWGRAWRSGSALSFILVDIDLFKGLNDSRGHQEGDDCLRRIAECMGGLLRRSGDLPARYGGEEFAIVLPATDLVGAVRLAETLRRGIEALSIPHEGSPFGIVTASFGVAESHPHDGGSIETLVGSADRALYSAKGAGRNRVAMA